MKSQLRRDVENVIATTVSDTAINMDIDALDRMKLAISITEALIDALTPYTTQAEGTAATGPKAKRVRGKRRTKAEIAAATVVKTMTDAGAAAVAPEPEPLQPAPPPKGPPATVQPFAG